MNGNERLKKSGFGCNLGEAVLNFKKRVQSTMQTHFENCIEDPKSEPFQEGEEEMAAKINRKVTVDGKQYSVRANTEQEYAEKLAKLFSSGTSSPKKGSHPFKDYALNWFEVYSKPNIETVTATTYKRQLTLYLIPAFGEMNVEDITTDDIQKLFNSISGTKATKQKVKQVLGMVLDNAIEDEIITKNPLRSKRLKITGEASKTTDAYTVDQMRFLVRNLDHVKLPMDRMYLAVQALHPLRLEEALGLKWEDVDLDRMVLHIRRAVTHPTRNQPEIKATKTAASTRDIGLSQIAARHLTPGKPDDFVFGGEKPLSYTQVRKMCVRIKKDTGFEDNITPIRFRTTVLTDIYDQTHDIKQAQNAAGHTSPTMTLRRYVKGRGIQHDVSEAIDRAYSESLD